LHYSSENTAGLVADTDSDFAGDKDTARSTSGYVFIQAGGAVRWSSKRQGTVSTSTAEAKYVASCAAAKEAAWLQQLLVDLIRPIDTVPMFTDNKSSLALVNGTAPSSRTKHINVVYHYVRERVEEQQLSFSYIPTAQMVADVLTKSVPKFKVKFCCDSMGLF
jgi:hypothetical protein